jgi:hypothetical protein
MTAHEVPVTSRRVVEKLLCHKLPECIRDEASGLRPSEFVARQFLWGLTEEGQRWWEDACAWLESLEADNVTDWHEPAGMPEPESDDRI